MCDIVIATPRSTRERIMLFGKNSDRERNESQAVERFAAADHPPDAQLQCTYLKIPQARRTCAVLLSRPFWIWGAEMGSNEHGVVIGNEGLYARVAAPDKEALTGMDLVRLALERSTDTQEAVQVITTLLETHGQGGNCGHLAPSYYHNSFLIADAKNAVVLETVDREWLVQRIEGPHAISNHYSIDRDEERRSPGLHALLRTFGWNEDNGQGYSEVIADAAKSHIGSAQLRRARSTALLSACAGELTVKDIMRILRDHNPTGEQGFGWVPSRAVKHSLCVHAGAANRNGQTTGAMASEVRKEASVHWFTATAAPCLSIFKPLLANAAVPPHGLRPTDRFDARTLWWRHERLHRGAVLGDFANVLHEISAERDALEAGFHACIWATLNSGNLEDRSLVIDQCWEQAIETENRWYLRLGVPPAPEDGPFAQGWNELNRVAGLTW